MILLDGKKVAAIIRHELGEEIGRAVKNGRRPPGLAVILAGDDPASQVYVRNKQKACAEIGIVSEPFYMPASVGMEELIDLVSRLNLRDDIDGVLVQLPLPGDLDPRTCIMAIDPSKDVDGFHPLNMGKLALGLPGLEPCTPAGVMRLLDSYELSPAGKKAVVVGRSDIVGKPLALMLAQKKVNATVTICHSGTRDLTSECLSADYLFLAIGRPRAITADMVHEGCVVVDIGINRSESGLCGDVDYESVKEKAAAITPVPGGVGPMTVAMLLSNTVEAWRKRADSNSKGFR